MHLPIRALKIDTGGARDIPLPFVFLFREYFRFFCPITVGTTLAVVLKIVVRGFSKVIAPKVQRAVLKLVIVAQVQVWLKNSS